MTPLCLGQTPVSEIRSWRDLQQLVPPGGNAAELGVATGRLTHDLVHWELFETVYMVDKWQQVSEQHGDGSFQQSWHDANHLMALAVWEAHPDRVKILRGDTVQMAEHVPDGSLSFCFVDADHSYDGVTRDIEAWRPKMVAGGVMAFDDYLSIDYGVQAAVEAYLGRAAEHTEEIKGVSVGWFTT